MITLMDKYAIIKIKLTGMSNREIARKLDIDRKTVSKYWEEYQIEKTSLQQPKIIRKYKRKLYLNQSMIHPAEKAISIQKKLIQLWIKS